MAEWDGSDGGDDEGPEHPSHLPAPWEEDDYGRGEGEGGAPLRHDAFTAARRAAFLKQLARTGCLLDASRAVAVSARTVYRLQERDPEFRRHCELALSMARIPVELAAWERGVVGVAEEYVRGGIVYTRLKRSDSILRLLLQAANPKKYGARPGFSRKRLLKQERKQIERELQAEWLESQPSHEEVTEELMRGLGALSRRDDKKKLEAGWTKTEEGHWIPPGWARTGAAASPAEPGKNSDSV